MGRGCNRVGDAQEDKGLSRTAERKAAPCHLEGRNHSKRNTARAGVLVCPKTKAEKEAWREEGTVGSSGLLQGF